MIGLDGDTTRNNGRTVRDACGREKNGVQRDAQLGSARRAPTPT